MKDEMKHVVSMPQITAEYMPNFVFYTAFYIRILQTVYNADV